VRHRHAFSSLLALAVFLSLAPTALASSTWYVDAVHGSDNNDCKSPQTACKTIGHAISLASARDSIMVAAATYTENLTIRVSLKIVGSGATTTIIDGGGVSTVVTIPHAGSHVTLSKLTIQHGSAISGGGIYSNGTLTINNTAVSGNSAYNGSKYGGAFGGAICNCGTGTLTINNSTVSGNSTAGGLFGSWGGGIVNFGTGTLTINNSTVSGNSTTGSHPHGGGISNVGTLIINNCTLSGNSAGPGICCNYSSGGGIYNGGTLTINNSTLSGNSATGGVGGGGIFNIRGTTTLQDSIVAGSSGGNCDGTMTSNGYNLSSDGTCNFSNTGDLNNTDPVLGPLQNNGGPTQTQALLSGSPAIDAGNPSGCTDGQGHLLTTDQRGQPRPDKEDSGGCDMGAYESQKD